MGRAATGLLVVLALAAACSSRRSDEGAAPGAAPTSAPAPGVTPRTADDCQLFLTKSRATLAMMAKANGMTYTPAIEAAALEDCRKDAAAGKRDRLIGCVLEAKDEAGVHACFPRYDELVMKAGSASGSAAGSAALP